MSYTTVPSVVTGQTYSAANYNTYVKGNLDALWVYSTAGDIAYATGAAALARLGIGAANRLLVSNGSMPTWVALASILTAQKQVSSISTDTSSTTFVDIANATITLTLAVKSTILLFATASLVSVAGAIETIKAVVDGVDQTESVNELTAGKDVQWSYLAISTEVAAGSRVVKLQYKTDSNQVNFYNGLLVAVVIPSL